MPNFLLLKPQFLPLKKLKSMPNKSPLCKLSSTMPPTCHLKMRMKLSELLCSAFCEVDGPSDENRVHYDGKPSNN